jgi:hypothetical protein
MAVWYPLEKKPENLNEVNFKLQNNGFIIAEVPLHDGSLEYITALEENTATTIRATFDKLKAKLGSSTPTKGPDCAVVVLDDCEGWRYTY